MHVHKCGEQVQHTMENKVRSSKCILDEANYELTEPEGAVVRIQFFVRILDVADSTINQSEVVGLNHFFFKTHRIIFCVFIPNPGNKVEARVAHNPR